MRKTSKLISFAAAAALLLSGCGTGTLAPAVSDSGTTTSAAETTATEGTITPATTTASATTAGSEDNNGYISVEDIKKQIEDHTDPYEFLYKKNIVCENSDRLHLWSMSDGFKKSDVTFGINDNGELTAHTSNWKLRPGASYSSGAISAECDEAFRSAIKERSYPYFPTDNTKYDDTVITISGADNDNVYADSISCGYNAEMGLFVVNAFVRRCSDSKGRNANKIYYDFIIDPAFTAGMPMFERDPERLRFEVNGRTFCADTVSGTAGYDREIRALWFPDHPSEEYKKIGNDYVYARLTLKYADFMYDNIQGAYVECDMLAAEILTEDTDAVLDGTYLTESISADEKYSGVYKTMLAAKDEIFTEKCVAYDLIDIDFDELPEIIVLEALENDGGFYVSDGPGGVVPSKIYGFNDGKAKLLGEFDLDMSRNIESGTYIPTGEKGWHIITDHGHALMTLKNGILAIKYLLKYDAHETEDGWKTDFYYHDKKIELEPVDKYNPFTGLTETFYRWTEDKDSQLSYRIDSEVRIYDELERRVLAEFADRNELDITARIGTTGNISGVIENDPRYPADLIAAFDAKQRAAEYDNILMSSSDYGAKAKPVIYLYPEEQTDVSVKVNFAYGGEFTCTYPNYGDGWNVTAMPDGTLYDANGDEYYCLYWEGKGAADFDMSKGFCVAGADTAKFLREKLMYIGLTAREANEFIIYWLPKMQDNPYNVITLHTDDYARSVPLTVSPAPDTQIRVFMTYYSSNTPVDIQEQELPHYDRTGFTLVEWGGSEE
ncbi:MAG: hypothetical protein J6O50_11060 [Ruminiclostridium sp.]|nr:hypothetical protein [Ruminiclostridium sp.]